jgi:ubiquinone/menaquinone biosynthesis C-methylase UbiE
MVSWKGRILMLTGERLQREQAFHDRQARERWETWAGREQGLFFEDRSYLDHEPWIGPALDWLGEVRGLPVLDLGCGHGMAAVVLARRGAQVTGLDLSRGYLQEARARANINQVGIHWVQASGEYLPFADASFARIWGNAILHHLDVERAGRELRRILQPGGWAIFCEPWGQNPLLSWARKHIPYPGKNRTADEQPLTQDHLRQLGSLFPSMEVRGYQLLGMAQKFLGKGRLQKTLDWCDTHLLHHVPSLQHWCRYVVVKLGRG